MNSKLVFTLAFLSMLAVAGSASAQQADLKSLDTDGDGKVSTSEFKTYAKQRLPNFEWLEAFAKAVDSDGNGQISAKEFAGRMEALNEVRTNPPKKISPSKTERVKPSNTKPAKSPVTGVKQSTVLLITNNELAKAWLPFAEWKTKNGKATKIVTVSQIQKQYKAKNVQEQIRLCVREHIEKHGTRWVILGGDCEPTGGIVPGGHRTFHAAERRGIPTDIVYLSPTNWDADGDGKYGEFKEDRDAITYPDGTVGLGRIPVRTEADIKAFTAKVIAYESNYPTTQFAHQMVYTCTDSPAYPKVRKSWDAFVAKSWQQGKADRFFSAETPWDAQGEPGSHQLSAENLVSLINQKSVGKFHIHGHGLLPFWVLENSKFTAKDVDRLQNNNAYPLITTVSCNTGEYDSKKDPSIVESMIRKPNAGSVAIVAPIRTGKAHFHSRSDFRLMVQEGKLDGTTQTMTRYWVGGLGGELTTGEALMKAKAEMIPDAKKTAGYHLCICELNLLGDPTLDMRAKAPRTPKVTVEAMVDLRKQILEVKTDTPGATICVWKGKEIYVVGKADKKGIAKLEIHPKSAGSVHVTVGGPNLNSVSKTIKALQFYE